MDGSVHERKEPCTFKKDRDQDFSSVGEVNRDYAEPGDPYGISEYTEQSADQDTARTISLRPTSTDLRGNTVVVPRSIPTQEEADALKGDV